MNGHIDAVGKEGSVLSFDSVLVEEIRRWIRSGIPSSQTEHLKETLDNLRILFEAPRALMVWEEADEPWVSTAYLGTEDLVWKQNAPSTYDPLVDDRVAGISFSIRDAETGSGDLLHPTLCSDYSIRSGLSLVLHNDEIHGRIFILDLDVEPRHYLLGRIATAVIENRFARAAQSAKSVSSEVEQRIGKIARDLHDGLLQSFTGIVLQLENLIPTIDSNPDDARQRVTEIEGILMNEQRELRSYLEGLREKKSHREIEFDMTGRFRDLAHRYRNQWGVELEYRGETLDPVVRRALGWETWRIVTEAITNAARHGHAKFVCVTLSTRDENLLVAVQDNGEGFPFRGRLNGPELTNRGLAPTSLTERVHSLNGEISIESSDNGALLEISIPIGWSQI